VTASKVRKGSYILFMTFSSSFTKDVGSLGALTVDSGVYCYVGSAMNGLDQRIGRHLSDEKIIRWHIDRLTVSADEKEAYTSEKKECELAKIAEAAGGVPMFNGFGSSDCKCRTHLFRISGTAKEKLLRTSGALPFRRSDVD